MATPDPTKKLAVEQARTGRPLREVAAEFGVSHVTVARWLKDAGGVPVAPPAPVAPPPSPPPAEPAEAWSIESALRFIQGQLSEAQELAKTAKAAGHHDAAAKATRQIGVILPTLMQVLKRVGDDKDVVKIPTADFAAALRTLSDRMAGYAAITVHCAKCGREMRATTAGLAEDAQARLFDPAEKKRDPNKA